MKKTSSVMRFKRRTTGFSVYVTQYDVKEDDRFVVREFKPAKVRISPGRKRSSFLADYILEHNLDPVIPLAKVVEAPPEKKVVNTAELRKIML